MMQYRTSQNRDKCTNSRSLNSDGSGQSRYAAWVNAHNPASSGPVPGAGRKKFGSTPNRSATCPARRLVSPSRSRAAVLTGPPARRENPSCPPYPQ